MATTFQSTWGRPDIRDFDKSSIQTGNFVTTPNRIYDQGFTHSGQTPQPVRANIRDVGKSSITNLGTHTFPGQYTAKPTVTSQPSSGAPRPQSSGAPQMGGGAPQFGGGASYGGGGGGMPAGAWDMGKFASQLAGILGGQQQKEPEKPKTQAQLHPNGTPSGSNYRDPRMQSPSWIGGANLFDDKTHGHNFTSQLAERPTPAAPTPAPAPTTPTTPKPTTPTKPTTPAKPTKPSWPSRPGHGHGHAYGHARHPLARLAAARGRWW